jgi:hypothetical protein
MPVKQAAGETKVIAGSAIRVRYTFVLLVLASVAVMLGTGCGRLRPGGAKQYVYVVSKGTFLRDRVAAVSNRVADVTNGERLQMLRHDRRFLQVKTDSGKIGWLEEHGVIDQAEFDKFAALDQQHAHDPVVATAILRDGLFLHLSAGRNTEHLYLLPENDKLQLLLRTSVAKPEPPGGLPPATKKHFSKNKQDKQEIVAKKDPGGSPAPPAAGTVAADQDVPMEDWWLVRDQKGHVGWLLARRIDIDVPDAVAQYSEGKKMVGAYVLNKVYDEESASPDKQVAQYVTVVNDYKDGLPYDWSQVRIFIWNTKKHRYETAFRLRDLVGYLPVTVGTLQVNRDAMGKPATEPTFTIRTSPDGVASIDPATGGFKPAHLDVTTYRLEGGIVRKVDPTQPPGSTGGDIVARAPVSPYSEKRAERHAALTAGAERKSHHR